MSTIQGADVLSTRHLDADLKGHTVRGTAFTVAAQAVKFALQIASIAVLARLLSPSDFGLVAMVSVVTMFLNPLKDGGLSMATIQRQDITHAQVSNLFWLNAALGLTLTALVILAAPALAAIYGEPRVTNIAVVMAAAFLISGLSVQHNAVLRRQMRFKALAIIDVVSLAAGIAVSIGLAALGLGYWALVAAPLVSTATRTLILLMIGGWCPARVTRGAGTRALLLFGANVTGASFIANFSQSATPLAIGVLAGPHTLGLYNRASTLILLPLTQILSPVMTVVQPALSRMAVDPLRFRRGALSTIRKLLFFAVPISITLTVLADLIVGFVLGDAWQEATIIIQILSISILAEVPAIVLVQCFVVYGRADVARQWQTLSLFVVILSIFIGSFWGWLGVVIFSSLSSFFIRTPIAGLFATRILPISLQDFFATIVPFFLLATLLLVSLFVGRAYTASMNEISAFTITILFGAASYFLGCLVVKSIREEIKELFQMGALHLVLKQGHRDVTG